MGFERDVRMCNVCSPSITDADRRSLAILFDARHPILRLRIEESLNLLLTIGRDRVLKGRIMCGRIGWKLKDWHGATGALKHWISERTVALLKSRRNITAGPEHNLMRRIIRREVRVSVQADREVWWTQKAKEMEEAQKAGNAVFQLIRTTGPRKPPGRIMCGRIGWKLKDWHGATGALKHWISERTVALLKSRRNITAGPEHNLMRRIIRREVRVSVQADREVWWTQKAKEMEEAQKAGNAVFQLIRTTGPRKPPVSEIIKDRKGVTISNK
ncbi:WD repeat and FYVE domain-containing protein 1 [Clonorchis sinensis]|uniref:WD repeat and FYVE domain-containing protein 1 n=1 Tax=Clonorchis sinensis TaxID=79923 RepID=G7Y7G5_CLOSI|nr:WD repeat and FYVE domain-containing protein 1 [Clonorchis sinensis]